MSRCDAGARGLCFAAGSRFEPLLQLVNLFGAEDAQVPAVQQQIKPRCFLKLFYGIGCS
jgi:hypothetical protein